MVGSDKGGGNWPPIFGIRFRLRLRPGRTAVASLTCQSSGTNYGGFNN
jgi:hypothetical protein